MRICSFPKALKINALLIRDKEFFQQCTVLPLFNIALVDIVLISPAFIVGDVFNEGPLICDKIAN